MIEAGRPCDPRRFFTAERQAEIEAAFARHGIDRLAPVKEMLGPEMDYGRLHVARAFIQARLREAE